MSIARVTVVKQVAQVQVQPGAGSVKVSEVAKPAVIQVGITGPQGPAHQVYLHAQATPAATWTINHNLGLKPDIALIDAGGNEVEGAILHTSDNQAVASFAVAIAGTARCS